MSRAQAIAAEIPRLRRYARALTGDAEEADDLVQDCLERALTAIDQWRQGDDPRKWLFAIMHNLFIDAARRSARRPQLVAAELADAVGAEPASDQLDAIAVDRALALLSPEHREVILLVGLEGFNYREAAEALDIPVGTLMSRLARGRARLRELMAAEETPARNGHAGLVRRIK
jgi:RNA polymerase sigma-70 factor (ECF subfamily)